MGTKPEAQPQAEPQATPLSLATLLNNLPGMAYRCRFDGRRTMLFVSQGALDLTGFSSDRLVGKWAAAYDDLIFPDDRPAVSQEIETAVEEKRPYLCTYRLTTADGKERWVLDKGEAVFAPDGTVAALEGFVTDHTGRMTAFQSLERRVADRTRKLSALYDILEVASDPSDLQTTITRSLRRVLKAIKRHVGVIHLLDKSGQALYLVAQQGLTDAAAAQLAHVAVPESPLAGWVVRFSKPLFIPKMHADERASDLACSSGLDVFSAVPIIANEQARGVLTVLGDGRSRLEAQGELELLASVGEQLGIVVENARLRQQAEQLAVLEERNRLARELHDSVTQSLYSVTLFAEAGLNLSRSEEYERAARLFDDVLETGQQALKEMRLLVHKLRPSVLEKEGLVRALQHRLNAVEGRAGVRNQLVVEGALDLSVEAEEVLYFVAQEALNNAIKHAIASEVWVYLQADEGGFVSLAVRDNGGGFDLETAVDGGGLGLTSMRERVELRGGEISFQSTIGQGTEIRARLPIKASGEQDER